MNLIAHITGQDLGSFFALNVFLPPIIVHLCCAVGVSQDVARVNALGGQTTILGRFGWTAVTLCLGLPALALYWVMHYSTLIPPADRK